MIQQVLAHYRLPLLSCAGLLLFFSVFVGVMAWVFRRESGRVYADLQNLPLSEDRSYES